MGSPLAVLVDHLGLGISLSSYLFGDNSWIGFLVCTAVVVLLATYRHSWASALSNIVGRRFPQAASLLRKPGVILGLTLAVSLLLLYVTITTLSVGLLQPNVFAGWTDTKPLSFGRHVGTIAQAANGNSFCGRAIVVGDIKNTSGGPLTIGFSGQYSLWSSGPAASYNAAGSLTPVPASNVALAPGEYVTVTMAATQDRDECKDYKPADLVKLRTGRLNASGHVDVTDSDHKTTQRSYTFEGLPIYPGG